MYNIKEDQDFIVKKLDNFKMMDESEDLADNLINSYTTKEQRIRDREITNLLQEYVNYYRFKTASNG